MNDVMVFYGVLGLWAWDLLGRLLRMDEGIWRFSQKLEGLVGWKRRFVCLFDSEGVYLRNLGTFVRNITESESLCDTMLLSTSSTKLFITTVCSVATSCLKFQIPFLSHLSVRPVVERAVTS